MEDDDKQVYFTKSTWDVLEQLENAGFCKVGERYVLARIAIALALARGLEASPDDMKGRSTHYQLEILEPLVYAIRWRYPEEHRPYWRMSNLAHAGCEFIRANALEIEGNTSFIELITDEVEIDLDPWTRTDVSVEDDEDQI